jgi:excisionase family DNA binding protein
VPDRPLTVSQAARTLGVCPQTVTRLVELGRIRAVDCATRTRRAYRIDKHDLAVFVLVRQTALPVELPE